MKDSGSDNSEGRKRQLRLSSVVRRAPLFASLLVGSAVLAGLLFYVQAGLLVGSDPAALPGASTASDLEQTEIAPAETKQQVLKTQKPVKLDETKTPASQPDKKPSARPACDQRAKAAAENTYRQSLDMENKTHEKHLSQISTLLKWLGLSGAKTKAEHERHDQAVRSITEKYRTALAKAGCQS